MFTGIVEEIGTVSALENDSTSTTLTISPASSTFLSEAQLGDSIAINGTCLTITTFNPTSFTVGVAPETLRRTNLGSLRTDSRVNLERAVQASTRMGGHFVQGHVDTIAEIVRKTPDGDAVVFRFKPRERDVLKYIVEKGFIALDGASLTITGTGEEDGGWFEIMLIKYSQEKVVMARKEAGDGVNVEVDMVGKYVEKCVVGYLEGGEGGKQSWLEKLVEKAVDARLKER